MCLFWRALSLQVNVQFPLQSWHPAPGLFQRGQNPLLSTIIVTLILPASVMKKAERVNLGYSLALCIPNTIILGFQHGLASFFGFYDQVHCFLCHHWEASRYL